MYLDVLAEQVSTYIYTHIHIYACTHTHTHVVTDGQIEKEICTWMCLRSRFLPTYIHIHIYACTHTRTCSYRWTDREIYMYLDVLAEQVDCVELAEEPGVDLGQLADALDRVAALEGGGQRVDALVGGIAQLLVELQVVRPGAHGLEANHARRGHPDRFLHRLRNGNTRRQVLLG